VPAARRDSEPRPVPVAKEAKEAKPAKERKVPKPAPVAEPPAAATTNGHAVAEPALAIPEYDQLSASQVVERLDGLTPAELDEVRAYELAHRGRSTILGKIVQLSA
jgi:hypothetical protein